MQANYFLRFLSTASILGIVTTSFFLTLFILINWVAPDLLILGQ
ncbi:Photosystem I reaction center subunit IX [Pseudanabaenaceae cyanobacterium LEGE 13415]|nr:Photosystem I reaction center subunit IX [Pseudanabaenaceae cyanobacterium LEGE 13415]